METEKIRPAKKQRRPSFFAALLAFPARVADWLASSALGRFFHAYQKSRDTMRESRIANRLKGSRLRRLMSPLRMHIGALFTRSPLSRGISRLGALLRFTPTRTYGILFGTFGLYTILVFVVRHFAQWARGAEYSALVTGIMVSVSGTIGFVGLIVPHFARRLVGNESRFLLPFSTVTGAAFVSACELVSRLLFSPYELPVGILMSMIGGPVFVILLVKMKGGRRHA